MDPKPGQTRDDMAAEEQEAIRQAHASDAEQTAAEIAQANEEEAQAHRVAELERQIDELENRRQGDPTRDPAERLAYLRKELKAAGGGNAPKETTAVEAPETAVQEKPRKRSAAKETR